MSDQDLVDDGELIEEYDYQSEDDEDDYFSIALYKSADGRLFRYVIASGMNSVFHGAQEYIDKWFNEENISSWKRVD